MNDIKTVEFHCASVSTPKVLIQAGSVNGDLQELHVLDEAFWHDSDVMLAALNPFADTLNTVERAIVLECNPHVSRIRSASLVLVAALNTLVDRSVPVWAYTFPGNIHRGRYTVDTVYDMSVRRI